MAINPNLTNISPLWASVDRLVDRAAGLDELVLHRIHLFAARRWRAQGRPVPPELVHEEDLAAVGYVSAPEVLRRVREACDGPILLVKGLEVARRYPDPLLRPFRDLDLIVSDAQSTQRQLLAAGFEVLEGDAEDPQLHHRPGLLLPGLPVVVEVHDRPKWPRAMPPPRSDELLAIAVPAEAGVDRVLSLPPAYHAVLLAAHAWAHLPLRRALDLVDVQAMAEGCDCGELEEAARRLGVLRIWRATLAAADALLFNGRRPLPFHTWARNLPALRERTVLESHLEHWTAPFWELEPRAALVAAAEIVGSNLRPKAGENWPAKLRRTLRSIRHSFMSKSRHEQLAHEREERRGG